MVPNRKFHPLLNHYFLEVFSVSWVDGVMNSTRAMNSHGSDHVDIHVVFGLATQVPHEHRDHSPPFDLWDATRRESLDEI